MNGLPDILNTPIINIASDAFWQDNLGKLTGFEPRPVVVITTPFQNGTAEDLQLKKMLQACQLTEQEYNIIRLEENERLAWHLIREQLQPKYVILLGITADQLGISIHFMPHQVSRFNDCSWVVSGSLQFLMQHEDIKKHVWNYGLKPLFIDKIYG